MITTPRSIKLLVVITAIALEVKIAFLFDKYIELLMVSQRFCYFGKNAGRCMGDTSTEYFGEKQELWPSSKSHTSQTCFELKGVCVE